MSATEAPNAGATSEEGVIPVLRVGNLPARIGEPCVSPCAVQSWKLDYSGGCVARSRIAFSVSAACWRMRSEISGSSRS